MKVVLPQQIASWILVLCRKHYRELSMSLRVDPVAHFMLWCDDLGVNSADLTLAVLRPILALQPHPGINAACWDTAAPFWKAVDQHFVAKVKLRGRSRNFRFGEIE